MGNDFFKGKEKEEKQEEEEQAPEQIEIGGEKYNQDELNELVSLGKLGREAEQKFNTKLDRVWPEYTKGQQKVKDLESKIDELQQKFNERPAAPQDLTPETVQQAREAARKLGIVTEDQFDQYLDQRFRTRYLQERQAEKLLDECDTLEKEWDGKDGRPAFNKEKILNHMVETGIKQPKKAYKDMFEKELDAWKERQLQNIKPATYATQESAPADKMPRESKITDDNLRAALEETLYRKNI